MKIPILILTIGLVLPVSADPQFPAKPLSPPPLAASNPTPSNLQSSTDSSISHEISFVSGTPILTKEGRKSAEDIVAGVSVWATDPTTHKSGYHTVTRVSLNSTDHLMQLLTDSREKIEATPDSLFWVNTKGWIEAKSLFPGEQLLQKDGTFAHVFNVVLTTS